MIINLLCNNGILYIIVYSGTKYEDTHSLISKDICANKRLTRKVMKKRNIPDVGQTCYEQLNLSAYIQIFMNLFATSIDYIYFNEMELLSNIHQNNDTTFMKQTLHQSCQDLVSYQFQQSKSLLRVTSLFS